MKKKPITFPTLVKRFQRAWDAWDGKCRWYTFGDLRFWAPTFVRTLALGVIKTHRLFLPYVWCAVLEPMLHLLPEPELLEPSACAAWVRAFEEGPARDLGPGERMMFHVHNFCPQLLERCGDTTLLRRIFGYDMCFMPLVSDLSALLGCTKENYAATAMLYLGLLAHFMTESHVFYHGTFDLPAGEWVDRAGNRHDLRDAPATYL